MQDKIQVEVNYFLDQYYNNPQIESLTFLKALEEKLLQFPDPEEREKFIQEIIRQGKLIRAAAEQFLKENGRFRLPGNPS